MKRVLIKKAPKGSNYLDNHYVNVSDQEADRLIKGGYVDAPKAAKSKPVKKDAETD